MCSLRVDGLDGGSTSECSLEAFELQTSLWELVSQMCPAKELSEVRRILGHSLVEQSCDLHDEASALLEIWRQFREDTDDAVSRVSVTPSLPEPPLTRERLVQEIQFFVDHLQQKQQQQRWQMGGKSVSALSDENRDILDYIARRKEDDRMSCSSGGGSRPMNRSSGGGSRPMSHSSGGGSRPMSHSSGGGSRPMSHGSGGGSRPMNRSSGGGSRPMSHGSGGGSRPMNHSSGGGSRPMSHSSGGGSRPMSHSSGGGSCPMSHSSGDGSRPMSCYNRVGSRPVSMVSSRDGRETPLRHTPSSEEGSQSSVLSDNLEAVNTMNIDTVVKHLRDVLEEECAQRRRDILFLQGCLDGEEEHRRAAITEAARPEPTLQELREFGTRLEREILHEAKFKSLPTHSWDRAGDKRIDPAAPRPLPPPSQGSHPPAANVMRASRVKRPEACFRPSYSSTTNAKPPTIINEPSCVDPIHSFGKGLKTTPSSFLTPTLSNAATPLDLPLHRCHSRGACSHCTDSSSPQAGTHSHSSLVKTNSTSTGSSYGKPIT